MGKIERIMYPCRYWKNNADGARNKQDVYSDYSEYEQDIKPDIRNKFWQNEEDGMFLILHKKKKINK